MLARQRGLPERGVVALMIAEGNLEQFSERWGDAYKDIAREAFRLAEIYGWDAEVGDNGLGRPGTLRETIGWVVNAVNTGPHPHDISFGCVHLIYLNVPVADRSYSAENLALARAWMFDPANCIPEAVRRFEAYYHPGEEDAIFRALCRYNWPAGNGRPASYKGDGGRAISNNYRRAIAAAERMGY